VSSAGLVPLPALARRCGLHDAAGEVLSVPSPNAAIKTPAVVAGMIAGGDSIDVLDRLRRGGMARLFTGIRAAVHTGHVLALVHLRPGPPTRQPRRAGVGERGPAHPTPPRRQSGLVRRCPRAASFVASTLTTARRRGAAGLVVARMDSAFFTTDVGAAVSQAGAQFSITARLNASVRGRIATIAEDAWTPIHYPNAIWDDQARCWVSDADSTETQSTHRRLELGGGRVLAGLLSTLRVRADERKTNNGRLGIGSNGAAALVASTP
jgi:hypothetical protein